MESRVPAKSNGHSHCCSGDINNNDLKTDVIWQDHVTQEPWDFIGRNP